MGQNGIRAAVIGLGGMGRRHLQAIEQAGMAVAAICDTTESAFRPAASLCNGSPRTYTDWRTLLKREARELDLLTVATNGPSHHEIAVAAARAGISFILCEKPMATSGGKAREMARVCAESGTRLAVNYARRFVDRFVRLKHALMSGVIGDIHHVSVSVGAGGLGCIGMHYFDLVSWLAQSRPVWVIGEIDPNPAPNVRGPQFHDPGGRGLVGYANGMTACFQLSGAVAITPLMQIIGTDGFVDSDGWTPPTGGRIAIFSRPPEQRAALKTRYVQPQRVEFDPGAPLDVVQATRACLEDLVGAHREDTVASGIATVDTVMAFHLSAQRGWAKVELPLTGPDLQFDVPIT